MPLVFNKMASVLVILSKGWVLSANIYAGSLISVSPAIYAGSLFIVTCQICLYMH